MGSTKENTLNAQDPLQLQPDPLVPTPESVERYIASLQLAYQEAAPDDTERQAWIKVQVWNQLRLARAREASRAAEVRDTLQRVFRLGTPANIDGFKPGIVLGFVGFGPINGPTRAILNRLHPWLGKDWNAETQTGINILTRQGLWLVRPLVPAGQAEHRPDGSVATIPFKLWVGQGIMDPDCEVLKIDYDIPENKPAIRSITDEQVEIVPDVYLGKGLVKIRGRHRFLLFFANRSPEVSVKAHENSPDVLTEMPHPA